MKIPKVKIVKKKLNGQALGFTHFKKFDGKLKGRANPYRVEIDVKAHKGDMAELASTVKHELLHVKHPTMTEKQVYKKSAKTKIPIKEQKQMLALLDNKKQYKVGGLIEKMNKSKKIISIKGLV